LVTVVKCVDGLVVWAYAGGIAWRIQRIVAAPVRPGTMRGSSLTAP